ncbi:MAG: anhydro-N-acetylmuramic acid kinase [Rubrivivax sp.]
MTAPDAARSTFIGLMSGTSADGVDGVLAHWPERGHPEVICHRHRPFDAQLRLDLLALNSSGPDELHRAAEAATQLSSVYASVVSDLLDAGRVSARAVRAIGAHGQTVRHQPGRAPAMQAPTEALPRPGYTVQLLNGAWLAELCGIDVICDFRSADVAAGGQGAPLVPAAHDHWFARNDEPVAVLNLGGMANLSLLPPKGLADRAAVVGFDTGPGNVLIDLWVEQHLGQPYDHHGSWAASGQIVPELLASMIQDPYFARLPPKSTGRDHFDAAWLRKHLNHPDASPDPLGRPMARAADIQATLTELTALTVVQALRQHAGTTRVLLVCGGGARNLHLMSRLAHHLPHYKVEGTDALGYPVDQVEALAFAWLAKAFVEGLCANLPAVTGARRPKRLGAYYPASCVEFGLTPGN